jgi:hypothetical protein
MYAAVLMARRATFRASSPSASRTPATRAAESSPGRPPTGLRPGEKSSEYLRLNIRIPPEDYVLVDAAAAALAIPQWRFMVDAARNYVKAQPASVQKQIADLQRSRGPVKLGRKKRNPRT